MTSRAEMMLMGWHWEEMTGNLTYQEKLAVMEEARQLALRERNELAFYSVTRLSHIPLPLQI